MRGNRPSKRGQPLLALAAFVLASCASAPAPVSTNVLPDGTVVLSGKTDSGAGSDMSPVSAGNPGGTALAVPSREELKKNALDQTTLSLLQIGSPEAIREAVGRINSDSRGMTEQNRLALALAGELMRILYPLEAVTWPTPSVPDGDNYLAIVKSARLGVYDFSAGNSDYLSLVLPSLVLYVSPVMGDWADEADASLEKAASLNRKSVLAPLFRALIAERRGKLADAETQYRRAWDLDSSCYPAGVSLSRILSGSGRGDEALSISRILLARYPESLAMTRLCAEAASP
jgi:tetratricopeptide (TPR) repeat protein